MTDLLANRYRPIAALGRGAMGEVFRVADTLDGGREVAFKQIRAPGPITPELRLRFKEEFRAMARLRHPNTIEVYDYGQLDAATRYLTMELVEGRDLAALTADAPLALERVYPLLVQLLQALAFIHARGYVHRDVKAANVLVREDGHLKLMDFGLMATLGGDAGSKLEGTPATIAPEILRGGPLREGCDLYAVGCLAHQLVTGRLPFEGAVREVLSAHATQAPPPLRARRADAPERLEAIVARLLEKDPADRYAQAADVIEDLGALAGIRVTRATPDQRRSYLVSGVMVGREAELATLGEALAEARAGRGRAIYVSGPAGTGKTRLARELATQAKLSDLPVLEAACQEKVTTPYKCLVDALRPLVALAAPEVVGRHRAALERLFTELRPEGAGPPLPFDDAHGWASAGVGQGCPVPVDAQKPWIHAATLGLLRDVAHRTPVVWLMDDLQWCDPRSLQAFHHVLRHLPELPLLAIATIREDELSEGPASWVAVAEGRASTLRIAGLPPDRLPELLTAMLGPADITPAHARALHGATGGNPLFVTEVLRDLLDGGLLMQADGRWRLPADGLLPALPARVEETVLRRLARLSPAGRSLARVGSALGRHLNRDMWRAVSGLAEDDFLDRLDELVERQFVARDGARLTFPHDRVREALYADLEPGKRAAVHRRCGEYLEDLGPARRDALVNKLAHHFCRSDDPVRGFAYGRLAGDRAQAAGMALTALRHWRLAERCLAAAAPPDQAALARALWWDMGHAGYHAWPDAAIVPLEALFQDPGPIAVGDAGAEAEALLAVALALAGRPAEGLARAEAALARTPATDRAAYGARLMAKAPGLFIAGRFDDLRALTREALDAFAGAPGGPRTRVERTARVMAVSFANAGAYQGYRPDDAVRDRALALAEAGDVDELAISVGHYHGLWCAWAGQIAEGEAHLEAAARRSRRLLDPFVLYLRPCLLMQEGAYEEAAALVAQARRAPAVGQLDLARHLLDALDGMARFALGDLAGAATGLAETLAHARAGGLGLVALQALLGLGRVALARDDRAAAEEALGEALALASAGPTRNPLHAAIALRLLAGLRSREGRTGEAEAALDAATATLAEPGLANPLETALIAMARGDVAKADPARREAARRAYLAAGDAFHALGNRYRLYEVNGRLEALHEAPVTPAESPEARWMYLRALNM